MDSALQKAILERARHKGRGRVIIPKDVLDLGERAAIDQAFSRLTRAGDLQRLGRGLYYYPRINPRLRMAATPDIDDIAEAIGRQTGTRLIPSGAVAANRLGLSTQVPAKPVYLSDGRSRRVRLGSVELQVKHVTPKELPVGSLTSAIVFQALRHIGKDAVNGQVIATVRAVLSPRQRRELLEDARYTTDWIRKVASLIADSKGKRAEVIHG